MHQHVTPSLYPRDDTEIAACAKRKGLAKGDAKKAGPHNDLNSFKVGTSAGRESGEGTGAGLVWLVIGWGGRQMDGWGCDCEGWREMDGGW